MKKKTEYPNFVYKYSTATFPSENRYNQYIYYILANSNYQHAADHFNKQCFVGVSIDLRKC